jgi:putative sporulation protein YyaC
MSRASLLQQMKDALPHDLKIEDVHFLCIAVNVSELASQIPSDKKIIAIDASLGNTTSVGRLDFKKGPVAPGAGVNKDLGRFGDYAITGVVNVSGFMEYFVLQNTRLSMVMKMASEIVDGINYHFSSADRLVAASNEGSISYEL